MNKPNFLIIVADQQRYDCIGYAKDYPVITPNIDKLAAEGMWFNNAYTPIPVCCPARQAFLNGQRAEAFGALWNYGIALETQALSPEAYSWVRELEPLGYKSSFIGKWSGHPVFGPESYGFHDTVGLAQYTSYRQKKYSDRKYQKGWLGEVDTIPYQENVSHWLASQAITKITEYSDIHQPWHLRLDFPGPHLPCRPSPEFAGLYTADKIPKWRSFHEDFHNKPYIQRQQLVNWDVENFTWEDWAESVALYYGMVSEIDHAIGTVLDSLDSLGITENTIVIYTADHGDMCGGHKMVDKHYVLYDDVVKVPLIIRWPHEIAAGARCNEFVCHFLDLPPTILEILGLASPEFFHGKSLMDLLKGINPAVWRDEVVSTYNGQQFGLYTQRMIRNHDFKYIWNTTDIDELYDLQQDPEELHNVIYEKAHQSLIATLRRKLYETLRQEGDGLVNNEWMRHQLLAGKKI